MFYLSLYVIHLLESVLNPVRVYFYNKNLILVTPIAKEKINAVIPIVSLVLLGLFTLSLNVDCFILNNIN
jgi:hypothetical protein